MSCFQRFKYDSKKDLHPLCNVWKRTGLRYLEYWNHLNLRLLFRGWMNNPWIFELRLEPFNKQFFSMLKNWINGSTLKHPLKFLCILSDWQTGQIIQNYYTLGQYHQTITFWQSWKMMPHLLLNSVRSPCFLAMQELSQHA